MMKGISVLGSTGSIGTQTLDVVRSFPKQFKVVGLAAHSNVDRILEQIKEFKPNTVSLSMVECAEELERKIKKLSLDVEVLSGKEGLKQVACLEETDTLVNAVSGIESIEPMMKAIKSGKNIAIANKESIVVAGELIMKEVKNTEVQMVPIDSEHSAIFQCLHSGTHKEIKKLILTASGGPFRNYSREQIEKVSVSKALNHPTWKMGRKITIDSATLMNKGFEVIETHHLFDVSFDNIDVLIHPQSIVHSMVEFIDGSVMAQLGIHDMRVPIQYALTYPNRLMTKFPRLDLIKEKELAFEKPNTDLFPCLEYGFEAGKIGGTMPAVVNAADEVIVNGFLSERISFVQIPEIIEKMMKKHRTIKNPSLKDILKTDRTTRKRVKELIQIRE